MYLAHIVKNLLVWGRTSINNNIYNRSGFRGFGQEFFFVSASVYLVAVPNELLSQVIKHDSVGSAVAFLGQITVRRPPSKREARKILYCEGYSSYSSDLDVWKG